MGMGRSNVRVLLHCNYEHVLYYLKRQVRYASLRRISRRTWQPFQSQTRARIDVQ